MFKYLKRNIYNPIRSRVKRTKELVYLQGFINHKNYLNYNLLDKSGEGTSKRLLYVGSGKSVLEYRQHDLTGFQILAVNNAIKAFDKPIDYYLCSTNFPAINKPPRTMYKNLVDKVKYRYDVLSHAMYHKLGFRPQIGKTIFLDGLYWAMASGFTEIYLLGFDHDYNKKRVEKWKGKYTTDQSQLADLFNGEGEEPDAFYGQNTPDPLRYGEDNLIDMFETAKEDTRIYGCKIYNLSSRQDGINVFERVTDVATISKKNHLTGHALAV